MNRCDTCEYYEEMVGVTPATGTCHRNPPVPIPAMTPEGPRVLGSSGLPTLGKSWCGEWKKGSLVRVTKKLPPDTLTFPGANN